MKKIVFLFTVLLLGDVAVAQIPMVRLTRFEGQHITGIDASTAFEVELIRSDKSFAVVEINAKYENSLRFDLDSRGVVTVSIRSDLQNRTGQICRAKIYLQELDYIKASGASSIQCTGSFQSHSTDIELNGASNLKGLTLGTSSEIRIQCSGASNMEDAMINCHKLIGNLSGTSDIRISDFNGNLSIDLSGASYMQISGMADETEIKATGASSFDGKRLSSRDSYIQATFASNVDMGSVKEILSANGSSASNITYKGEPATRDITISSASTVKKEL